MKTEISLKDIKLHSKNTGKGKLSESESFDDSRDKSDNDICLFLENIELHSRPELLESEAFDYKANVWKEISRRLKEQVKWRCQKCNLSLRRHKYYLHTHHIRGVLYNKPEDLRVLCIGCHSEQPGNNHYRLKETRDYRGFMKRYGKEWRQVSPGTSSDLGETADIAEDPSTARSRFGFTSAAVSEV